MFRMYGNRVEVLKYQISYTEYEEQRTDYAATEEEANAISDRVNGTVSALPASDDAWMDGIEVADVPDTYGEAVRIYQMGQAAYEAENKHPTAEERLAALESAMIAMMGGVPSV